MHLSGDNFYVRGKINDETASLVAELVDTNRVTNPAIQTSRLEFKDAHDDEGDSLSGSLNLTRY